MKAIETLRRQYDERSASDAGLPGRQGGYDQRVFVGHGMTPADIVALLQAPLAQTPTVLQDPATGDLYEMPGVDPPGTRPTPP